MSAQPIVMLSAGGRISYPSLRLFWVLGFAYASFTALLLQKAILPIFPEMHAGHGLFMNDAIVFHNMAVRVAQEIHSIGWSAWHLHPQGASANVGLLSFLYAVLGPDPAWFIPFNAAAHATGALMLYQIGGRLVDGDVGKLGGLLSAICFLVFPSALQWYGQNHKDAFAIVGMLLGLDAWLMMHDDRFRICFRDVLRVVFFGLLGAVLVGVVRPYYVTIMVIGFSVSFLLTSIGRVGLGAISARLLFIVLLAVLASAFVKEDTAIGVYGANAGELNVGAYAPKNFLWADSENIPAVLDKGLRRASELRTYFVQFGRSVGAGSEVDGERLPDTAWAAIAYLPRALVVGLFAPFPDTWGERVTVPRLIGAMETACWYIGFLGVVVTIARYRSRKLLAGIVFCGVLITILAYIHPNVGTLYRQRFGLWHFFMLIGCIGWVGLLQLHLKRFSSTEQTISQALGTNQRLGSSSRVDNLTGSGALVMLITLVCYLGFFARDLLLIGQLGLGADLDALFSAMMIPMFFVGCLAMPLGDALVAPFLAAGHGVGTERSRLLQGTLGLALCVLGGAVCFAVVIAPWLSAWGLRTASPESQAMAASLLRWFSPIVALSAWTVVGNAAMNSLGKSNAAALAQLAVPVVTLAALVFAPSGQIMTACVGGMLLGALLNTGIIYWCLRAEGLMLRPGPGLMLATAQVRRNYWPLVAAATLPAALIPMNYAFASSVSEGTLAAWAFSSKIVVLFSGLVSVAAAAVVLPRMTQALMLHGERVRHDANLLIAAGVWVGGVLMLGGFLFAEPLVATLLEKHLSATEVMELGSIVKLGVMQIPVIIIGALLSKLAIAAQRPSRVLYAAILGFVGNLIVNVLLVPRIGVMGVAVGALAGGILSVIVVLMGVYRQVGLLLREILIALACWLSWVAVCVGLISHSAAALGSAAIVLCAMARLHWVVLSEVVEGAEPTPCR